MSWLRQFLFKFTALFRRRQLEQEMAEEMAQHLEVRVRRNVAAGMEPEQARFAAQREFGGTVRAEEECRDERRFVTIDHVVQDFRFAARQLRKTPGYTCVVVLTLALGIGVNSALFSWFNAAAFRPLPVQDPGQLFAIKRVDANGRETGAHLYSEYAAFRDHLTVFAGLAASAGKHNVELADAADLTADGETPPALELELVSGNYFGVFGVPIVLGRPLLETDESSTDASPVIVLSHRFWQNRFGGDPEVIGRKLRLRGLTQESLTVIGVTAPEFHGTKPGAPAGWAPSLLRPSQRPVNYTLTGRLREGVALEHATEELQLIANQVGNETATPIPRMVFLRKASTYLNLGTEHLVILLPMVGLFAAVLVVSCANASNLILARAVTRQFEFAVRGALGASRGRLLTLLLTESLLLGILGGAAGWAFAAGLLRFVWPWLLDMMPQAREMTAGLNFAADHRVFLFTLSVSMLAGLVGGLLPAWHVTRRNVVAGLNREGTAFGRGIRVSRVRRLLTMTQLALSAALLFTAGLLVHRVLRTQFQDVGFDKARILTFEVLAPRDREPGELDRARADALERIRALPEVAAVTEMVQSVPFGGIRTRMVVPPVGTRERRSFEAFRAVVPADYFATLGTPLVRGRGFATEETSSDGVVVVNATAARTFWPDGDAIGQRLDLPTNVLLPGAASPKANDPSAPLSSVTVIGITGDTRGFNPWSGDGPMVFLPAGPQPRRPPFLLIRTTGAAKLSVATLRQIGRDVTGVVPRIATIDDLLANAFVQYRVVAWAAAILAVVSLLVAVIGLHGMMAFSVNQRVKEIGVRMALGATPRRVASTIVRESLYVVTIGTVAGYGLSVVISKVARQILSDVSPFDPIATLVVALGLAGIGILASWVPARRAAKVDPMVALRCE